jgi:hypothetical protein
MTTLCEDCTAGPTDIGGHEGMRARSLNGYGMTFACSRCHGLWTRTHSSNRTYVWALSAQVGPSGLASLPPNTRPEGRPLR